MKLLTLPEGIYPIYGEGKPGDYSVYFDLEGILVDLRRGIRVNVYYSNWKDPAALIKALSVHRGDPMNEDWVRLFYSNLKKTQYCDYIWNEANKLYDNVYVLTTVLPQKYATKINLEGLRKGKLEWCVNNLQPKPKDVFVVGHNTKGDYAGPDKILIDGNLNNIKQWSNKGGFSIPYVGIKGAINGLQNPGGEMDVAVTQDAEGYSTHLPQYRRGSQFGRYSIHEPKGPPHGNFHLTTSRQTMTIKDKDGDFEGNVQILAVHAAKDKMQKYLLDVLKKGSLRDIQWFLEQAAIAIDTFLNKSPNSRPDVIVMPESSSQLVDMFIDELFDKLEINDLVVFHKNTDPNTIEIDKIGAAQFAAKKNKNKKDINPLRKHLRRGDPEKYKWTTNDVVSHWRKMAEKWATGGAKSHELDMFVRRNLSNLYVTARNESAALDGSKPLIVDDISTFHTTMKDIGRSLYNYDISAHPVGAVLWMSR